LINPPSQRSDCDLPQMLLRFDDSFVSSVPGHPCGFLQRGAATITQEVPVGRSSVPSGQRLAAPRHRGVVASCLQPVLLTSLYIPLGPIRGASPSIVPRWAYLVYVIGAVGMETWHEVEHLVIISKVLMNNGCPCPGIGDAALSVSDTVLHFSYNAVVTSAILVPFWYVVRAHRHKMCLSPTLQGILSARDSPCAASSPATPPNADLNGRSSPRARSARGRPRSSASWPPRHPPADTVRRRWSRTPHSLICFR
jgi:hypothetical protein